jgi:hypothetical protein
MIANGVCCVGISKAQKGITLIEAALALAIAASIIVLSLKFYKVWMEQVYIEDLRYNIDVLFNAMGNYYRANCGFQGLATSSPTAGSLMTTTTPQIVSLSSLSTYLPSNWLNAQGINNITAGNILDNTTGLGTAYILQYNLTSGSVTTNCSAADCGTRTPMTIPSPLTALVWRAQVAVKILNTANIRTYATLLGADCISSLNSSGTSNYVNTCEAAGSPPATLTASDVYLVWERMPSLASPDMSSSLWVSMPALKQFNLQYTHDQFFEYSNSTYINNSTGTGSVLGTNQEYYVCGS